MFEGIPGFTRWAKVDLVPKGWFRDAKYYIETDQNEKLLLRISDISEYQRKEMEYEALRKLDGCSILMSRPVAFGTCNAGNSVFMITTWIDGIAAEEALPRLTPRKQYDLGCVAGRALKELHKVPAPEGQPDWAERFSRKIDRNIRNHGACDVRLPGADRIIRCINSNRHLLENRPQVFQHGDYHCGNMIVTNDNQLGIIDFNRLDFGDPWEEFNRIVWCASVSGHFASGRINGYFGDDVPEDFFRLMALYIGSNMLSSIPWAIPFGQEEVDTMLAQGRKVLDWYDGFQNHIPRWYVGKAEAGI